MSMVERFREQAAACEALGSPMYAALLHRVGDDIEAGGVSAELLAGHERDPGPSALALRLLGSVHRLVLDGRVPGLAAYYPSAGGVWDPEPGWTAFAAVLGSCAEEVRAWLDRPPQTNEVGRAAALVGGLLRIGEHHRLPVRLLEIGSSGGLNLCADRFWCSAPGGPAHGPPDSPVRLDGAWRGRPLRPWPDLRIVERLGSDVSPVDVTTAEGRLTLMSYVWPDQTARFDRLRGALRVSDGLRVEVRRQDAVSFVRGIEPVEGVTTVLWHSVMWQYLSAADQAATSAAVDDLGASARETAPFAHLFLEPGRRTPGSDHEFLVVLCLWPGGERRILGTSVGHGVPTTWE
ncbi:MAG TPA: DUF2332 domain-containing protein [Nocardioidaceae bacterium]|nr:DUF2332 domain-containing protein [Nocardioidaceae bacterium]